MNLYIKGWHWPHVLFFASTPLVAVTGTWWVIHNGGPHWATWGLTVAMLFACGIGTTGGYHRLFTHRSYTATWPVRLFFLAFGGAAFEGSALWWSEQHRIHHRYVDTDKDPYGINKGFWHAHLGWLLRSDHDVENFDHVKDLEQDPLIQIQHRFYPWFAMLFGFGLPTALGALWGDPWGGFFIAGVARMVFNHHATFCINSFCHYIGKQTYSDKHSAKDSWIAALITYGEGYHNFHHEFQYDYRNGIRAFHWDPTKWAIQLLAWMRLVTGLRMARQEKILHAKLMMDQKRFARNLPDYSETVRLKVLEIAAVTEAHLRQACARFQELKLEYQKLKREKMDTLTDGLMMRREELKSEMQRAKHEFKMAMAQWKHLMRGPVPLPPQNSY